LKPIKVLVEFLSRIWICQQIVLLILCFLFKHILPHFQLSLLHDIDSFWNVFLSKHHLVSRKPFDSHCIQKLIQYSFLQAPKLLNRPQKIDLLQLRPFVPSLLDPIPRCLRKSSKVSVLKTRCSIWALKLRIVKTGLPKNCSF